MAWVNMIRPRSDVIPEIVLPDKYTIWTYSVETETWIDIIHESFGELWTTDKFNNEMIKSSGYKGDNIFFLSYNGLPVGTITAWVIDERQGYLHMLGIIPEHQHKRLGYILGLKVLQYLKDYDKITLITYSDRLSAIKTYLNLGFVPYYKEENDYSVWSSIFERLRG